ncbi:MAG: ABC transporter ATP-binding protein [Deltaproteobacteria bacterium]|nr:ABC transporter ATP-binding protein [Deltaproteobacteria bacterium]
MSDQKIETLTLDNISKIYGERRVLFNLSLQFKKGEIVAVTGANGAGKTTLLNILATVIKPSSGNLLLNNNNADAKMIRSVCGYLSHEFFLYSDLTCEQNLKFFSRMYGVKSNKKLLQLSKDFLLAEFFSDLKVSELSRGQLQKSSFARVFAGEPSLVFLDEPLTALDDEASKMVKTVIQNNAKHGGIVIFASHKRDFIETTATREVILENGKIVSDIQNKSLSYFKNNE